MAIFFRLTFFVLFFFFGTIFRHNFFSNLFFCHFFMQSFFLRFFFRFRFYCANFLCRLCTLLAILLHLCPAYRRFPLHSRTSNCAHWRNDAWNKMSFRICIPMFDLRVRVFCDILFRCTYCSVALLLPLFRLSLCRFWLFLSTLVANSTTTYCNRTEPTRFLLLLSLDTLFLADLDPA